MQGKSRSVKSDDLTYIFFQIRATRCPKTRRSWQRRARLALAKRDDLTPAEQHEICAVWSKSNVNLIDSPAMSKLQGKAHRPQPYQTISARSCTRRRYALDVKKPSFRGLAGLAPCNDAIFNGTFSHKNQTVGDQPLNRPIYATSAGVFPRFQEYISPHCRRDNGAPPLLCCDNRSNPRHHHAPPPMSPKLAKLSLLISVSCLTFEIGTNQHCNRKAPAFHLTNEQRQRLTRRSARIMPRLPRIKGQRRH